MKMQLCKLLLLFAVVAVTRAYVPAQIKLGGLFPVTGHPAGPERQGVFRLAIEEINNRTDILPFTELVGVSYDTHQTESGGLTGAIDLIGNGVVGIVGSSSSSESKVAAIVASVYKVPIVSYASTDPALSNKAQYPYFARVVPPDTLQGSAIVSLVKGLGWRYVSILYSTSSYGTQISQVVIQSAAVNDVQILTVTSFYDNSQDLSEQMKALKQTDSRIIIVLCQLSDVATVFREANKYGLIGSDYVWIGSDAVVQSTLLSNSSFADLKTLMSGVIGTRPQVGVGDLFQEFLDTWATLSPAQYPGSGNRNVFNSYDTFVYDAVLTYAYAFDYFVSNGTWPQNMTTAFSSTLHNFIVGKSNFTGLTGQVSFDGNGDRVLGYDIVNLQVSGTTASFVTVGSSLAGAATLNSDILWYGGSTVKPIDRAPAAAVSSNNSNTTAIIVSVVVVAVVIIGATIGINLGFWYFRKNNKNTLALLQPPDFAFIEFGELRKSPNLSRSKILLLLSLQEVLLKVDFISVLVPIVSTDEKKMEVYRAILYTYRANNKAQELLSYFARQEISKSKEPSVLFREENTFTIFFRRYGRVVGMRYLWDVLAFQLIELKESMETKADVQLSSLDRQSEIDENTSTEMASKLSALYEVDPNKAFSEEEEKISKLNLLLLAQKLFYNITHTVDKLPIEIKNFLGIMVKMFKKAYPDQDESKFVGAFLFLRFFCPAIISPHLYGIFPSKPDESVQRTLILVSKVLQNLANGILFGSKEEFMSKLNDFITSNEAGYKTWVSKLVVEEVVLQVETDNLTYSDDSFEVIPDPVHHNCLNFMRDVVVKYKDQIFVGLEANFTETEVKETREQLNLIYSIA